jgi:hypothetical protein
LSASVVATSGLWQALAHRDADAHAAGDHRRLGAELARRRRIAEHRRWRDQHVGGDTLAQRLAQGRRGGIADLDLMPGVLTEDLRDALEARLHRPGTQDRELLGGRPGGDQKQRRRDQRADGPPPSLPHRQTSIR